MNKEQNTIKVKNGHINFGDFLEDAPFKYFKCWRCKGYRRVGTKHAVLSHTDPCCSHKWQQVGKKEFEGAIMNRHKWVSEVPIQDTEVV